MSFMKGGCTEPTLASSESSIASENWADAIAAARISTKSEDKEWDSTEQLLFE